MKYSILLSKNILKNKINVKKMSKLIKGSKCDMILDVVYHKCEDGCCDDEAPAIEAKTADWKNEKHVPVVEKVDGGIKVYVGSTLHPMTDEHYITMIEVSKGNMIMRASLKPGDAPEAIFPIDDTDVLAQEYCNIHGLWANK